MSLSTTQSISNSTRNHREISKNWDTELITAIVPNMEQLRYNNVEMHLKHANGMAESVDSVALFHQPYLTYETEFVLFFVVLENSVLPMGCDSLHAMINMTS